MVLEPFENLTNLVLDPLPKGGVMVKGRVTVRVVGRLDIVPYIRTFVQYDGTFGASDQGETLDV